MAAKRTPPRGDRVSMYWNQTAWGDAPTTPPVALPNKFTTASGELLAIPPTKAGRKAARKAALAPAATSKGARTTLAPSKPSRRVRRAALVARKAAYREAMRDWVLGVSIDNADALRAIALRVASERPTALSHTVGGMDRGLEAMESAAGRELPTRGPFIDALITAYHEGQNVWHKRKAARDEVAKVTTKEGRLAAREDDAARKGRMSAQFHPTAPLMRRELHLRVYDLAEGLIKRTFRSPATVITRVYFRLYVTEQWSGFGSGKTPPQRYEPHVNNPSTRGKNARVNVTIDPNVLPLWRAGLAGHFGPKTLVLGIDRENPAYCFVARQNGPYTFATTRRRTPPMP